MEHAVLLSIKEQFSQQKCAIESCSLLWGWRQDLFISINQTSALIDKDRWIAAALVQQATATESRQASFQETPSRRRSLIVLRWWHHGSLLVELLLWRITLRWIALWRITSLLRIRIAKSLVLLIFCHGWRNTLVREKYDIEKTASKVDDSNSAPEGRYHALKLAKCRRWEQIAMKDWNTDALTIQRNRNS